MLSFNAKNKQSDWHRNIHLCETYELVSIYLQTVVEEHLMEISSNRYIHLDAQHDLIKTHILLQKN